MAIPTDSQIDEAVPVDGTPSRAKTNAVLKSISASIPMEAVNAMDVEAQIYSYADERLLRRVNSAPETMTSYGESGQWFADSDHYYQCISPNMWRRIDWMGW